MILPPARCGYRIKPWQRPDPTSCFLQGVEPEALIRAHLPGGGTIDFSVDFWETLDDARFTAIMERAGRRLGAQQ